MTITPHDLWPLLVCTVRYALGRASYVTSEAPDLVLRYRAGLEPWQLHQIAREIREHCERWPNTPEREQWLAYATRIEESAVAR